MARPGSGGARARGQTVAPQCPRRLPDGTRARRQTIVPPAAVPGPGPKNGKKASISPSKMRKLARPRRGGTRARRQTIVPPPRPPAERPHACPEANNRAVAGRVPPPTVQRARPAGRRSRSPSAPGWAAARVPEGKQSRYLPPDSGTTARRVPEGNNRPAEAPGRFALPPPFPPAEPRSEPQGAAHRLAAATRYSWGGQQRPEI